MVLFINDLWAVNYERYALILVFFPEKKNPSAISFSFENGFPVRFNLPFS